MRLVCDANPFCIGSTSTLLAVLEQLPEAQATVLGTGPTLDLCAEIPHRECNVRDPSALKAHRDLLETADAYVAFSNNTNIPQVVERGLRLIFVDIHYAMKRRQTPAMEHAATYVIERHPGVAAALQRYTPSHPRLVGPLISSTLPKPSEQRPLLVNLGGASSPDLQPGENTHYPQRMVDLISRMASVLGMPEVLVAMGSRAAGAVQSRAHVRPCTLSRKDYLSTLASSRLLLTAPGLNAPLEGFRHRIPVCFLPPQNLTQVVHLQTYVDAGLAPSGLNLTELLPDVIIDPGQPEYMGTAAVVRALRALTDTHWEQVERAVMRQITRSDAALAGLAARQHAWITSLGLKGPHEAAQAIREVVQ